MSAAEVTARPATAQPVMAGVVTAVVGFASSFAVVLAGLTAVGASPAQAGSGLAVLCLTMGLGCIVFSLRTRVPVTMAWSTPGAALLATAAAPAGGFGTAVGAFLVTGALLALTGLVRPLADAVRRIPTPIANAMLAGVLLNLCAAPFLDLARDPASIAPIVATWLVLLRLAPRWAVPGALAAALAVMGVVGAFGDVRAAAPQLTWAAPSFDLAAVVALALPLYVVTMTSQNIPGIAVLASFGYHPPLKAALTYTGAATVVGAPLGGHAVNLAAISAALAAGPEAGPDRDRRWVAGVACGVVYLAFGPLSPMVTALSQAAPAGVFAAVAGLGLVASFAAASADAMGDLAHRQAAAVTFLVAASSITVAGVGAAFWALLAGLVTQGALTGGRRR